MNRQFKKEENNAIVMTATKDYINKHFEAETLTDDMKGLFDAMNTFIEVHDSTEQCNED